MGAGAPGTVSQRPSGHAGSRCRARARSRPVGLYFVLAFALSWAFWLSTIVVDGRVSIVALGRDLDGSLLGPRTEPTALPESTPSGPTAVGRPMSGVSR